MNKLQLTKVPMAKTGMLVRKPVAAVIEAIINPDITTKFWFTKSSGRLEVGKKVKWEWEMYNASTEVTVKSIEPNKRILIEWQGYSGPTTVEWKFSTLSEGTFVGVTESGSWHAHPKAFCRIHSAKLAFNKPIDGIWLSDHFGVMVELEVG